MITATRILKVNTAILRQINADDRHLQSLLTALHDLADHPVTLQNHRQRFVRLLQQLRDQLAFHFALEEAHDYFADIIDTAPQIAERLRCEHATLLESIRHLAAVAEEWHARHFVCPHIYRSSSERGPARCPTFLRIAARFQQFSEQLREHEQCENALIREALESTSLGERDGRRGAVT